ncbi:hypothetical protein [Leptospira adleri]|uniref:Cytochrome C n=1 Tax=Leptospira adleri TaxID=2023186 RepID=A0A2M9YKL0_9LEPT|nr:hypothetical protein [Leptospira adleri]PJZ52072.1 hypothetical protein CH380_16660 [Leptospira adleri]PJZ62934.1 hypothetical protein CH376_05440 [Leptospira adleri]
MNFKNIPWGIFSFILWIGTTGLLLFFFVKGNTEASRDGRTSIHLTEDEKLLVLGEMRGLLTSLNGIIEGLSEDDSEKAAQAASNSGMGLVKSLENEEKAILLKLPLEFKRLGFGTHEQFDRIAVQIRQKQDLKVILKGMDDLTKKCVACHTAYKIEQIDK